MRTLWRISNHADLSGEGAKIASARWHTRGNRVVYLAESAAGAMLERLVHLLDANGRLPRTYDLLEVEVSNDLSIKDLLLPSEVDWRENEDSTRHIGDSWLGSRQTALARVPSAIMPRTWNVLLNPEHPDALHARVAKVMRERFDSRLFRFGSR
jgi:RES domain-containing protein